MVQKLKQRQKVPTMITKRDLERFILLYYKHFNIALDEDTARAELCALLNGFKLVYQPITIQEMDVFITHRRSKQ